MGKSLEKPLFKKTYLNSDDHMKSLFKTLVISEIETQPWYHFNPRIIATKLETIEDIEQLKLSEISGKQYMLVIHFEKWYGDYLNS